MQYSRSTCPLLKYNERNDQPGHSYAGACSSRRKTGFYSLHLRHFTHSQLAGDIPLSSKPMTSLTSYVEAQGLNNRSLSIQSRKHQPNPPIADAQENIRKG
eukprot:scaffold3541_cov116-Cylindrotheca_fusiformis.AAC.1